MTIVRRIALPFAFSLAAFAAGCTPEADRSDFVGMELNDTHLTVSPTNAFADDPAAASLGQRLFFDRGLSSDGTVACVSCHDPAKGFSDDRAFSIGVRGQAGDRHSMPVTAAVLHPSLLWDGKADSAWSQPLKALENPKEMDFSRVEVAHRVADRHRVGYEDVFGPLPDLSALPRRAQPGDEAWSALDEGQRDEVQRVFANVGKALEAYERKLLCVDTRFDKWLRGEGSLSDEERAGGATFKREGCANCHSGPTFSDGIFHNIGVPSSDRGRAMGAPAVLADLFNGAGPYSDDRAFGEAKLALVANEVAAAQEGAFRTPSLRGVGQRRFFGHAAHQETVRAFVQDMYTRGHHRRTATVGSLDPALSSVHVDGHDLNDLVAFLHTLDCPAPPPDVLAEP